jgi:hypothetical protein
MEDRMTRKKRLNVSRLVDDLGGASAVARICGVQRTAPYGWIRRGYVGSRALERIKAAIPQLDLDYYFDDREDAAGGRP